MSLLGLGTGFGKGLLHQVAEGFRYVKELSKEYLGPTVHSIVSSVRDTVGKIFFMKGEEGGKPSDFERNVIAPVAEHVFKGASKARQALHGLQTSHWHTKAITNPEEKKKAEEALAHGEHNGGHAHPPDTIHDWGHFFHESVEAAKRSQKPEPEIGSDEWHIIQEQKARNAHSAFLESEKASKLVPETSADQLFIPGVIQEINRRRIEQGFQALESDAFLTDHALHTASIPASNPYATIPEDLLRYRVVPFVIRKKKEHREAHGIEQHAEAHGGHEEGHWESDQEYAARIREAHTKRQNQDHQKYDEFTIPLDLINGVAFDGDPRKFVDKLIKYSSIAKDALFGETGRHKKLIGLGIQKRGSRTVVTIFLMKESPAETHDAKSRMRREETREPEMKTFSDKEWFNLIPEEERENKPRKHPKIPTIYEMYHKKLDPDQKALFKSGYTLYQYYLLKKNIERLNKKDHYIGINKVKVAESNPVFGQTFDGIQITLNINGKENTAVTLIKGTDTIMSKEEYVVDKKEGEKGWRTTYQSLAEFIQDLDIKCEAGEIQKRANVYPRDDQGTPTIPPQTPQEVAAEEEEEEEARAMGLQG